MQGNYTQAQTLLAKAPKTFNRFLPKNHKVIVWLDIEKALLERAMKNYQEAQTLLHKALVIYQKIYGITHIKTADLIREIGYTYLLQNDLDRAEKYLQKSLQQLLIISIVMLI